LFFKFNGLIKMVIPQGRQLTEITLNQHDALKLGDDVYIQIHRVGDSRIDLACFAPDDVIIHRAEIENIKKNSSK
jgi:sRNA-binding carbon storage regulator CsrA